VAGKNKFHGFCELAFLSLENWRYDLKEVVSGAYVFSIFLLQRGHMVFNKLVELVEQGLKFGCVAAIDAFSHIVRRVDKSGCI
jgi:hypothetical protein